MDIGNFLYASGPLDTDHAVAALLVLDDGRYLMQLRDDKPDIFYPAHWGLFGGGVDPGEEPLDTLYRELAEELRLTPERADYFMRMDFDLTTLGQGALWRIVYQVPLSAAAAAGLVLGEGAAVAALGVEDLLVRKRVVPYDAFTIWLHHARHRLAPPGGVAGGAPA